MLKNSRFLDQLDHTSNIWSFTISLRLLLKFDSPPLKSYNSRCSGGPVAQLGERYNRTVEVKGSSPFRSTEIQETPALH